MLSSASKNSIRAVLFLSENSDEFDKHSAKSISKQLSIPLPFISKLLKQMAKNDIISSLKGPKGGFFLTPENKKKNVCDIIHIMESKKVFSNCFLGLPKCGNVNPCPVHHIVASFRNDILDKFEKQSIEEFAKQVKEEGTFLF